MWLLKKKIWAFQYEQLIRQERDCSDGGGELFDVFAVTYIDLNSGKTKIEEEWRFAS